MCTYWKEIYSFAPISIENRIKLTLISCKPDLRDSEVDSYRMVFGHT